LRAAFACGARDFGESYVQEALPKLGALRDLDATWHYIGHLQGNKAREVAREFDWVHGVDRARIAQALSRARPEGLADLDVCVQVNISAEGTKAGVEPAQALALAREVAAMPRLRLRGVMGMASATQDGAEQRRQFRLLKRVFDEIAAAGIAIDTLSMGMSDDLEAALAEGATMVRIGTAIFGARVVKPGSDPDIVNHGEASMLRAQESGSDPT
jgi:pyridoxal phosphate enzyme (YggS family)